MSPARRFTVRLYQRGAYKHSHETNLDPDDPARLRELLEQRVEVEEGTLRLDLANGWELRIHTLGGGRIHARVSVDGLGRTVVRR